MVALDLKTMNVPMHGSHAKHPPHVLIRPAALKEKPGNGKYRVFQSDGTFARPMAKEDVAAFLFDAVGSDQRDGKGGFQLAGRK